MKLLKKIFPIVLALVLACAAFTGCGCGKKKNNTSGGDDPTPGGDTPITVPEDPNAKEEIKDTDRYVMKDGASDYTLIVPENATANETYAAAQLADLFKEATGITLATVSDSAVAEIGDGKYIVIGDTKFSADYKPAIADLTTSGYRIQTVNNSVFVVGTTDIATRYGQIRFCEYLLGYEYFYPQVYLLNKNVTEIKLMQYDVRVKPHLEYNSVRYNNMSRSNAQHYEYGMRMINKYPVAGRTGHAALGFAPIVLREDIEETFEFDEKEDYANTMTPEELEQWSALNIEHWKWYCVATPYGVESKLSSVRSNHYIESQFCYTAHGDAEEYDALTSRVAQTIIDAMKSDPQADIFDFSPSDNKSWCDCDACKEAERQYGAKSGLLIKMGNDACAKVDKWMADEPEEAGKLTEQQRNFLLEFYAYFSVLDAPVKLKAGSTTEYEPTIQCGKHIYVKIADIDANYSRSIYHEDNDYTRNLFDTWSLCSPYVAAYTYCNRYGAQLVPYDTINAMQDWYKYLAVKSPRGNYNLGMGTESGIPGGWSVLRTYLGSKWGVDANLDKEELLQKFFTNVYKNGARYMRQVFDEYSATEEYNRETFEGYSGRHAHYLNIKDKKYWSKGSLTRWKNLINQAIAAIAPLKATDAKLYTLTYDLMLAERLTYDYLLQQLYINDMAQDEQIALAQDLLDDINATGITETKEAGGDIDAFKSSLQSIIKGA